MEYIDGSTLEEIVRNGGPLDEAQALTWTLQLLDALAFLHACTPPVIVRDLKPSNVMVGSDGKVRVIDFGIAKLLHEGQQTHTVARAATSEGYAPLEQYGAGGTDQRSDLYSLGATLLFMLTGQHPPDAVSRVTQGTPLPDPTSSQATVTPGTWSTIQKLMAISQSDRPASAQEVAALFRPERDTAGSLPERAPRPTPAGPPTRLATGASSVPPRTSSSLPAWNADPHRGGARSRLSPAWVILAVLLALGTLITIQQHRSNVQEKARIQAENEQQAEAKRVKAEKEAQAEKARQEEAARARAAQEARIAEQEKAYQADAQRALTALARLDARTDVGVNYVDYKAALGEVHYQVKEFTDKYELRAEGKRTSLKYISESDQRFFKAGVAWRAKIEADSDDYAFRASAESAILANWKMAATLIADSRKALERGD